jgi:hypothetical protein
LNITNDGKYAAIGRYESFNLEVLNIKTSEKMFSIVAHKSKILNCYFIEGNKAVSIDDQEIIYWDISDMMDWNKLFQVKKMNIISIHDSNKKLQGLIIDNKVFLLADALLELCDDKTQFKSSN